MLPVLLDGDGNALGRPRFKVLGDGFPQGNPKAVCVTIPDLRNGRAGPVSSFPLNVVGVPTPNCLIVELPPLPPGLLPAPLNVLLGGGVRGPWVPVFLDVVPTLPACAFDGEGPAVRTPNPVDPNARPTTPPPSNVRWFFSELAQQNDICLIVSGDWGESPVVDIAGDITVKLVNRKDPVGPPIMRTFELRSRGTVFARGGQLPDCAERIKNMIRCIFIQQLQLPPEMIEINCVDLPNGIKTSKLNF